MKYRPNGSRPPRNPFVAPARFRQAGVHRGRDPRQQSQQALRREIDRLLRPKP